MVFSTNTFIFLRAPCMQSSRSWWTASQDNSNSTHLVSSDCTSAIEHSLKWSEPKVSFFHFYLCFFIPPQICEENAVWLGGSCSCWPWWWCCWSPPCCRASAVRAAASTTRAGAFATACVVAAARTMDTHLPTDPDTLCNLWLWQISVNKHRRKIFVPL